MSLTNINDPAGVAALLEQLKSSTAWQELTAATTAPATNGHSAQQFESRAGSANSQQQALETTVEATVEATNNEPSKPAMIPGTSVASLLSLLSPFNSAGPPANPYPSTEPAYSYGNFQSVSTISSPPAPVLSHYESSNPPSTEEHTQDRKNFTFRQSLPVISELADDPSFVTAIKKMKKDQDDLERRLWADRESIYTKYQEKLKLAQTKAQMVGTAVSQHEITMINDACKKELLRFDHERVVPAWDGLVSRQQTELAQVNVPTMFVTGDVQDIKKQQQVIGVLESIIGPTRA